jgi:hypothetical protein
MRTTHDRVPSGPLRTSQEIREVVELPRLEPGQPVDSMFLSTADAAECAPGYSLAEVTQYESYEAAPVELHVEESDVARLHTAGNAVVAFSGDVTARQRANFVASWMFCTHGSDNKAGDVLDRLTQKLSESR